MALESLELQEQQQDVRDLEETLLKLDQHKEKLQLQIKSTRQLCVEESQKVFHRLRASSPTSQQSFSLFLMLVH